MASAFRRDGYAVWGLTRSQDRAAWLARNEINPVLGSLQEPDTFKTIAAESDLIVHAAFDCQADSGALDKATVQKLLDAARLYPGTKTLIYTEWRLGVRRYGKAIGNRTGAIGSRAGGRMAA